MTAVEWFAKQVLRSRQLGFISNEKFNELLEQAKEIEKEQMLNAFQESRLTHPMIGFKHETFVDYYKQTFKLK